MTIYAHAALTERRKALGKLGGRRRLLAVIRSDFEKIHKGIPKIQPQEIVPEERGIDEVLSPTLLLTLSTPSDHVFTFCASFIHSSHSLSN
jgi:hypothetical protein